MIEPIASHTMSLSHVENSRRSIIYPQNSMPRIGITGTKGHLKARGWCGSLIRRIITAAATRQKARRSEEHTSELQSQSNLVCRLLLEKHNAGRGDIGSAYRACLALSLSLFFAFC